MVLHSYGLRSLAGISREHLSRIESGKVSLTLEMKRKIIDSLRKIQS